ncbi:hypothetical protein AHYW_002167 [Providencia manganoxydans]
MTETDRLTLAFLRTPDNELNQDFLDCLNNQEGFDDWEDEHEGGIRKPSLLEQGL